jgi:alpha,alpha-trehalose-phosphate synthase [UDP-forming]
MDLDVRGAIIDQLCASLASHAHLTLFLDLDSALLPLALCREDALLDIGAVRVFGALHEAGVNVAIASARSHSLLAPFRALAPHVWWSMEHGTSRCSANAGVVASLRERSPEARIIAIGDDSNDDLFAALGGDDLAIGVGDRPAARNMYQLSGPPAVRAFLWNLVDARAGRPAVQAPALDHRPTAPRARLVVMSNRTPPPASGDRQRPVGGLVSALEPALQALGGIWLGWSGCASQASRLLTVDTDARPARASFDLSPEWCKRFYGGFCNRALWPLFHGFPERVQYSDADWTAYIEANAEFARHASSLVSNDGIVWAHDYHLLLAGHALRQRNFHGRIGMFLHIPFPPCDLFDTLPWASEIINAMLAFDLVGFHTVQWAENFRMCARRRARGHRLPDIAVLPIGIDQRAFEPDDAPEHPEVAGLRRALGHRRMILGVDRLDYAKGIPERLLAFEVLLETRPELRGQICFVQISVPSREDVPEYAELRNRVEMLVGRINGRFGEANWVPVHYLYRSYDHGVLAQLYRASEVALVTPLRDGLNLVAKEFVAAQDPARPGVLVLSRFAGAAEELADAIVTNPYHAEGLADDIHRALDMSLARRQDRHGKLMAALEGKTPQRWAAAFLDRLLSTARSVA